jgi:prephenate dehydrogenase
MMQSTQAEVVGMHPLFGPFMDTIRGQNVILCPGRGTKWFGWLKNEFLSKGANVREMDATTHDKNMAVFQGLIHIISVSMGRTLQKMNLNPAEAISYSTPVFRMNVDLIGRLFAQDLGLYEKLIGQNKYVKEVVSLFLSSMAEGEKHLLDAQVENQTKNPDGTCMDFLEDIQSFLGDFCQQALKESNEFLNVFYAKQNS